MTNTTANGSTSSGSPPPGSAPGDIGRRLRYWRERRGLSAPELAERAGINPGYLDYIEQSAISRPSTEALARLARALETTLTELLGGNVETLAGRAPAARWAGLVTLDDERCWDFLAEGGVGRLAFDLDDGPIALPVNFAVHDKAILFRTAADSVIDRIRDRSKVSLEADHVDDALRGGWSVIARGTAEHVVPGAEPDDLGHVRLDPWAGGARDRWMRLRVEHVSGREIGWLDH